VLSRSILSPLERFVDFLREVAASGDRGRRSSGPADTPEVRTLQTTYGQLMDSLDEYERRRLQQARDRHGAHGPAEGIGEARALGRMLSGAAHEINNPLTGVLGNIDLLLGDHAHRAVGRMRLEKVRREGTASSRWCATSSRPRTATAAARQSSISTSSSPSAPICAVRLHGGRDAPRPRLAPSKCRSSPRAELQQSSSNHQHAYDALKGSGPAPS